MQISDVLVASVFGFLELSIGTLTIREFKKLPRLLQRKMSLQSRYLQKVALLSLHDSFWQTLSKKIFITACCTCGIIFPHVPHVRKNNGAARAARTLVLFFDVVYQITT